MNFNKRMPTVEEVIINKYIILSFNNLLFINKFLLDYKF